MSKKIRLDTLLVEKGLIETREKAKRTIMAGLVYSENERLDKPGMKVEENIKLTVKGKLFPYVSRGGLKLEKALDVFKIELKDRIMIDIGSSTGGFTDCALQNGVKSSYAIDVGYNQLDWKLRNDPRVRVMERTNFRYVTADDLTEGIPSFASIDVSFISLKLILPVLCTLLAESSDVVALIKPQFEAGREQVGKKGIVRDPLIHKEVISAILTLAQEKGYHVAGLSFSPITGGDGNIEFLAHLQWGNQEAGKRITDVEINSIVYEAHEKHRKNA
ncbi:TlyA family RNA methyltransferase [Thalassobacillus pellis]|uniref:TlyA family RNA methyltransferase n=1 Tax=Thalassobacillus pellis TaxID=748008 RepID=UPI001961B310|nr:TlyA family RNA methyltransferase [Thalassobacillus pellis]MBM7552344.1 23S rRNA (cytidine1920-2'-O)/16S rRNA (cytidine1409-2'-O)-methyltransferase [Thalassobacillus pellis]